MPSTVRDIVTPNTAPIRLSDLDPDDLELIRIIVNEPAAITRLIPRIGCRNAARCPSAGGSPGLLRPSKRGANTEL